MKEMWELVDHLETDISQMADLLLANTRNQTCERAYIRIVFSSLEGVLNVLRQEMISGSDFDSLFTKKERAKLLEKKYDKKSDMVKSETRFLSLKDSIVHTTSCFAKHSKIKGFTFPKNEGWAAMIEAIKIRNRITHPKSLKDIEIPVSDLETVVRGKKWFKEDVMEQFV